MKAAAHASTSLDQPVGETEDAVFGDFVACKGPQPDEEVEVSLRSQALARALGALTERSAPCSSSATASTTRSRGRSRRSAGRRATRERVRQIEGHALKRLSRLHEIETVA